MLHCILMNKIRQTTLFYFLNFISFLFYYYKKTILKLLTIFELHSWKILIAHILRKKRLQNRLQGIITRQRHCAVYVEFSLMH
jgi:hypothetical protein